MIKISDGHTHAACSIGVGAGLVAGAVMSLGIKPQYIAFGVTGALLSTAISPDLDVDAGFRGNAVARGWHIGWLYHVFWESYRRGITHRNWRSHGFVISTIYRVVFCYAPITILLMKNQPTSRFTLLRLSLLPTLISLIFWILTVLYIELSIDPMWALGVFLGVMVGDIMHKIFDVVSF